VRLKNLLHRKMRKLYDLEHFRIKIILFTYFSVKEVSGLNKSTSPQEAAVGRCYFSFSLGCSFADRGCSLLTVDHPSSILSRIFFFSETMRSCRGVSQELYCSVVSKTDSDHPRHTVHHTSKSKKRNATKKRPH
jgi:hypothetical protein